MTGKQLQALLDRAGLSQVQAARDIGIADRTIRRYIADDYPIPRTVEYAIMWAIVLKGSPPTE